MLLINLVQLPTPVIVTGEAHLFPPLPMERLKSTGSYLAAEFWFAWWVALSATSIFFQYLWTLTTFVAVFFRSIWRSMLLCIEMAFEAAICFVRFLWLPSFRGVTGKSGIPGPAFDIAVVTAVVLFAALANTNLL